MDEVFVTGHAAAADHIHAAASEGTDDALSDGEVELHGGAGGEDDVTDTEGLAVADGGGGEAGGIDLDQADVGERVGADDFSFVGFA